MADIASAVTNATENRTFWKQSRLKNIMKKLRQLMGMQLSFILPPLEQMIAEVFSCGGTKRRGGGMPTMERYAAHRKVTTVFLPLASGDTPLNTQGHKGVRDSSGTAKLCIPNQLDVFRFMCDK